MSTLRLTLFAILTAVLLGGCAGFSLNLEDGAAVVTINVPEAQVQEIVSASTVCADGRCQSGDDEFFREVTGIDFREGLIHVSGIYEAPDGTAKEGSYDLRFGAEDGRLVVRLLNVDVDGVDETRIQRINAEMAADFAKTAAEGDVQFTQAAVTDDALTLQIRADLGR